MANWIINEYAGDYPGLNNSILYFLAFSSHELDGDGINFTGSLDVTGSNGVLTTLGAMVGLNDIAVSGSVNIDSTTLTVNIRSADSEDSIFIRAFEAIIQLFDSKITAAKLAINTIVEAGQAGDGQPITVTNGDDSETEPDLITDEFDIQMSLSIGTSGGQADIVSQVPIHGGMLNLTGDFTDLDIGLDDLNFLMGALGDEDHAWFPNDQLEAYTPNTAQFCLLNLSLSGFVNAADPTNIDISTISVTVGLTQLVLLSDRLYMDPLGVVITLTDTTDNAITPTVVWGLVGSAKLCNYNTPGVDGLDSPDFEFDFSMDFPNLPDFPTFAFSGNLENPSGNSVNLMLKDLIPEDIDIGLDEKLTVNSFEIDTEADMDTGTISSFYTSIDMSAGFGLLVNFDLESVSISVDYSA